MAKVPRQPDLVWQTLRLPAPARRALVKAGITNFDELSLWSESEVLDLHGVGPKAMTMLVQAMADADYAFAA
ncbi:MAG: DNA-binding protein [Actinomycetes bacterium]